MHGFRLCLIDGHKSGHSEASKVSWSLDARSELRDSRTQAVSRSDKRRFQAGARLSEKTVIKLNALGLSLCPSNRTGARLLTLVNNGEG